ncbi:hypothetical protein M5K25_016190 [Dendrobium thyrsiflorum]|uniref:Uncharacterized protein n=1 Tax=Dendrobium thyrsiflorum TaxID=117978 RepID=A0ABD0UR07_DENTH
MSLNGALNPKLVPIPMVSPHPSHPLKRHARRLRQEQKHKHSHQQNPSREEEEDPPFHMTQH